jgi:hypothetical protein
MGTKTNVEGTVSTTHCIEFHTKFRFVSFGVQEVFIVLACLVLHAIELFEQSIECLFPLFS